MHFHKSEFVRNNIMEAEYSTLYMVHNVETEWQNLIYSCYFNP